VTIAGRSYRMACEDGEEAHLEALAKDFDAKITDMRRAFGEIGDMRLHVMAALTLADQLSELRDRIKALEAQKSQEEALRRDLAERVNVAAERIERLSATLAAKPR
jgi:cell division protein ZapA